MRPTPRKRLDTQAAAQPLAAPNPAFAALNLGPLPPGPESAPAPLAQPARMGRIVLRRETAHRGGKTVVVVESFAPQHTAETIAALARKVRQACGCGGTLRERAFEVQGERVTQIRAFLEAEGFQVAGER